MIYLLFQAARKWLRWFTTVLVILFCSSFQGSGIADEYAVKGMFLYNFTKYIDWSASASGNLFVIAVFDKSEITRNLQQIAANKKVNNRSIEIRTVHSLEDAGNCQIFFIPRASGHILKEAVEQLGGRSILIVTEEKDMAKKGSCINIIEVDGKIKFELNDNAVKRDGLKIASQLEALAIHIK